MDDGHPQSLFQMFRDGIGDAMDALEANDDGEGWHKGRISSWEGESSKEEDEVERLGSKLEVLV